MPADASENLVTRAYLLYITTLTEKGLAHQPLALTLHKKLPVASGLGSSAASIVAALVAINRVHNQVLSTQDLLELAAQLEGSVSGSPHYDNVAPSLLGGMQLMTGQAHSPALALPFPPHWLMVVSFPGTTVSTHQARKTLPTALPMGDVIAFGRNLANFVHHLHTGNHRAGCRLCGRSHCPAPSPAFVARICRIRRPCQSRRGTGGGHFRLWTHRFLPSAKP